MDADIIKAAKDVLQNLTKSKKTLRMYPENNPIYIKTIDAAYNAFREFFDYREALALKIKQFEIIFDGDQVYYNPDRDENLALFFFKDGIRELTFKNQLQKEELEEFLKIISQDIDRETSDDDVVTLMWERDFQNITYVVDETFLADDEDYEERAVDAAKGQAAKEDALLKAYEEAHGGEEEIIVPLVPLTEEDISKIKSELDRDSHSYIMKGMDILFEMLFLSDQKDEYQDMVPLFRGSIDYALQYYDIESVVHLINKVDGALLTPTCPEGAKPYLRMVLTYINTDRVIMLVGELLDSRADYNERAINDLIGLMDKTAIQGLIKILGELKTIHARKAVINSLIILGKKDIASIARGLNDNRWFVVRNIIYVLRNIGDRRAVDYLVKKVRHNDVRVRKEVIKALGEFGTPEIVQHLRVLIDDPDVSIRIIAAKSLAQSGSPIARRIIYEKVSASEFKNRDFSEKKEFFEALARWNDMDVMNYLVRTLRSGSLFRRSKTNENRACAAHALGFIGTKEAYEHLTKFSAVKNTLIREYVAAAIKRIEHGNPAQRTEQRS